MSTSTAIKLMNLPESKTGSGKSASIFLAGIGSVGGTLLKLLEKLRHPDLKPELIGVCNSHRVIWKSGGEQNLSPDNLSSGEPMEWQEILRKLRDYHQKPLIFVDATGSLEVASIYLDLLKEGIHIVTPSKLANSRDQAYFDHLQKASGESGAGYLFETTVGAGLPVIRTIRDLLNTGDEIIEISGVLSGTMTYIFDQLEEGQPFSRAVVKARALGYAEPDPRDDLSGEDVVRKFLILARTIGLKIERDEVKAESLIPEDLRDVDSTTYLQSIASYDDEWNQRIRNELESRRTLRFSGTLRDGKIRVGIESVEKKSPLGQLTGTNNLILIRTQRYFDQPMVIQGPGAGKEVTASGVLSDILQIMNDKI
ncbi:MAG: hypothetical protein WDZ29_02005 [Balneolaceae bacterium]